MKIFTFREGAILYCCPEEWKIPRSITSGNIPFLGATQLYIARKTTSSQYDIDIYAVYLCMHMSSTHTWAERWRWVDIDWQVSLRWLRPPRWPWVDTDWQVSLSWLRPPRCIKKYCKYSWKYNNVVSIARWRTAICWHSNAEHYLLFANKQTHNTLNKQKYTVVPNFSCNIYMIISYNISKE